MKELEYKKDILGIEKNIKNLMDERQSIFAKDGYLTKTDVERLFEVNACIERWFEHESMLLPLAEDPATADRWNTF